MAAPFMEHPQAQMPQAEAAPAFASGVVGNPQDDIRRAEAADPTEVETPTDDEQQQYDDFVSRALALIADNRKPEGGGKSPSEATLDIMNNSSFSVAEALAEGASNTIMLIHNAAKRADKPYSPDVLFHGADEVIAGLYLLGSAAGIFKDTPNHEWAAKGDEEEAAPQETIDFGAEPSAMPEAMPEGEVPATTEGAPPEGNPAEGDFSQEEYMLLGEAKILATERFGRKLQESGQLTDKEKTEAQEFWKSQISKEVESGRVDDSVLDRVDVDAVRQQINQRGA